MERDFLGLNSNKDTFAVKEEFLEAGCEESGFGRSLGVPKQSSNKVSTLPHFMSLKSEQDDKPLKMKSDLLASHGGLLKSGADILGDFQNFKQQFLGGNPLTAAHSYLPSTAPVTGTTEQRINSKAPAQLTIFFGGTVNVFDDISPEKAQAIMFLAGNGFIPSNMTQSKLHKQASASKLSAADQVNMPHQGDHSSIPAANSDYIMVSTSIGMSTTPVNKVETPRSISSIGSAAATAMISSAVPQARKASLARFLEKRRERVMNASPYYTVGKNAADCESNGFGFSASSGVGSSSVSITK